MKKDRLESLLELFNKDPRDSFVKYGIGLEYLALKDYAKAEEFFRLILNEDPNYIPAYMQLGQLMANRNKKEEARSIFTAGIEMAKKFSDRHAANEMEDFLNELE
jgi:tetratricopeptide (TPR) repeat protein